MRIGLSPVQSDKSFIIGEPAECTDRIAWYAELGVKEIACLMNFAAPDERAVEGSMRFFAEHVMPHLSAL